MRLSSNVLSSRRFLSRGVAGAFVAAAIFQAVATSQARAQAVNPLDYVPASSGVFVHVRASELWNAPLIAEIRKTIGKDLDTILSEAENEIGIRPDIVETATFFYPHFPMGPGDEQAFVGIVVTNKPYDKSTILKNIRKKDGKEQDGLVPLTDKLFLTFLDDRTFAVTHDSLLGKTKKLQTADQKPGVMSEALKLAREKNQFVFSMDFSQLPNEIFTAAPAELKPFLPLLKTKSSTLVGNLKEKELKLRLHFTSENAEASEDAEGSFKLLMKLASEGLARVLKNEEYVKELGPLVVGMKEIERAVNNVKQTRDGVRLEVAMDINANFPIGEVISKTLKEIRGGSSQARALNNLKQIALAMHNYHDANNGFPASAICDKKGKPLLSWRVAILPYIEQQNLYMEFKLDEPWGQRKQQKADRQDAQDLRDSRCKSDGRQNPLPCLYW